MRRARWRRLARWLPLVVLGLALAGAAADARPGGGHSSGRSSRSSGGGGGRSFGGGSSSYRGGGGTLSLEGMIALAVVVLVIYAIKAATQRNETSWTSSVPDPAPRPAVELGPLAQIDPDFSRAVFEDFAFELYATAHRRRGDPSALAAYLSPVALAQLAARGEPPQQIVIGTLRIDSVRVTSGPAAQEQIMVRVEATHLAARGATMTVEQWQFVRAPGVRSKPPQRTRTWPCPNCGAPWASGPTRQCAHCGEDVAVGRFDWAVDQIFVVSEGPANASLTGTVAEYGNDLATVFDPEVSTKLAAISADDPNVTFEAIQARLGLIYQQLNTAWNANDLSPVRGLVTAQLRGYLEYWLREYMRQGLRNQLVDATITTVHLAKIVRDRYYDAITVRVFASGCDFTLDASGSVVGGSKTSRREYTEYWTLLRSSTRRGPITVTPTCPNCGAPLTISDAGDCTHCNAAVENGSFDWVLSKIEQDDYYAG